MQMELTLDCNDLESLATLWGAALGYHRMPFADKGYAFLEGDGIPLTLQEVLEPKQAKNRLHLDLLVEDVDAEVSRLRELGARPVAEHADYETHWWVLCDPEGNEFCVGRLTQK
jgi:predicted enzyme related to lactoylglutathione lyase